MHRDSRAALLLLSTRTHTADTDEPEVAEEDREWLERLAATRAERRRAAEEEEAAQDSALRALSDEQLEAMLQELDKERNERMNKVMNEYRRGKDQINRLREQVRARSKQ